MVTHYLKVLSLVAALTLAACSGARDSEFMSRGGPEALIDVSSEVVNLSIADKKDLEALSTWIATDAPTRAELQCDASAKLCREALSILEKKGVAISTVPSAANTVMLTYERILARDCNQRYRETKSPRSGAPAPSFGCAVSANIVQHVSDKNAFVNPSISDTPSSVSGISAIYRMHKEANSNAKSAYSVKESLTESAGSQ